MRRLYADSATPSTSWRKKMSDWLSIIVFAYALMGIVVAWETGRAFWADDRKIVPALVLFLVMILWPLLWIVPDTSEESRNDKEVAGDG